jgi:hypothetical protein
MTGDLFLGSGNRGNDTFIGGTGNAVSGVTRSTVMIVPTLFNSARI